MKKKIYMATAVLAAVLLSGAPRRAMCKDTLGRLRHPVRKIR